MGAKEPIPPPADGKHSRPVLPPAPPAKTHCVHVMPPNGTRLSDWQECPNCGAPVYQGK